MVEPGSPEDGDERRARGPRTWVVLVITASVLAVLVGAAVVVQRFVIDDDPAAEEVAPPTTVDDDIDVEPVSTSPTRLFSRTTSAGIEVRVYESDTEMFFGPMPMADDVPDWCVPESTLSVTALSADAIAQNQLPRTKAAPPEPAVQVNSGGFVEEAPVVVLLGQVADDVTQVRLSHAGGQVDTMEPIDGIVAMAVSVPMPEGDDGPVFDPWGGVMQQLRFEVLHDDGDSDVLTRDDLWQGIPMWSDPECMGGFVPTTEVPDIPELDLPDPGPEQPADPAGEQALIEANFEALFTDLDSKDTLFRLVDDPSGIDLIMENLMKQFGSQIREIDPEIVDLVFFSPIEASFTYTSGFEPYDDGFTGQLPSYGRARLVDGVWLITRTTVCQELMKAGTGCTV